VKGWQLLGAIERCGVSEQLTVQLNQKRGCLLLKSLLSFMTEMKERWCHFSVYDLYWCSAEKESSLFFLVWDMDWQCLHKRVCKHSLSTLDVQHLFKQIKFSYFTFDALNFLLTIGFPPTSFFICHLFQSGVGELIWGTHLSTWCMHAW